MNIRTVYWIYACITHAWNSWLCINSNVLPEIGLELFHFHNVNVYIYIYIIYMHFLLRLSIFVTWAPYPIGQFYLCLGLDKDHLSLFYSFNLNLSFHFTTIILFPPCYLNSMVTQFVCACMKDKNRRKHKSELWPHSI